MSDGVYGSFASKLTDALIPAPTVHKVGFISSFRDNLSQTPLDLHTLMAYN